MGESTTGPVHPEAMRIVVVAGPTAVGKSALALQLADRFGGEIVSVDSRQVYRHLDIGTAKPSREEREAIPHHLLDLVAPDQPYSAVQFRHDANLVLLDITRRGRVAFMVGGTGHYLQAVLDRLEIPPVPPDGPFRLEMEAFAREHGKPALHERLREVDPAGAAQIDGRNVRRVIRALEVFHATGVPFSEMGRRKGEPVPALRLALTTERGELHRLIDERVEAQIQEGLIEEARGVLAMGFDPGLPPLAGLVYREAIAVAQGRMAVAEAARRMRETTHAFARRQYTWFRRDPALKWYERGPGALGEMTRVIETYPAGGA
jgi:tRNA dimethylallyltransferase